MAKFTCNFISYTFKRTVDITVIIPSVTIPESLGMDGKKCAHEINEKYPVLYLLHGYGNNHVGWSGYTNIELYAEERNIAVVMFSGENKFYLDNESDKFYDFIENELPEFVAKMFPVSTKPQDTYIAGLSMGGFGTLVHAFGNPEKFAALGAFSAAVRVNPSLMSGSEKVEINFKCDPFALIQKLSEEGRRFPEIYISCGDEDALLAANQELVTTLEASGQHPKWIVEEGFGHEWRFWDRQVEAFLDWIPRTDEYAKKGRRKI